MRLDVQQLAPSCRETARRRRRGRDRADRRARPSVRRAAAIAARRAAAPRPGSAPATARASASGPAWRRRGVWRGGVCAEAAAESRKRQREAERDSARTSHGGLRPMSSARATSRGSSGVVGQRRDRLARRPRRNRRVPRLGARLAAAPARDEGGDDEMRAHPLAFARDRLDMVEEADDLGVEAGLLLELAQRPPRAASRRPRRRRRAANRRRAAARARAARSARGRRRTTRDRAARIGRAG